MITDSQDASGLPGTAAAQRKLARGASRPQQPGRQAELVIRTSTVSATPDRRNAQIIVAAGASPPLEITVMRNHPAAG